MLVRSRAPLRIGIAGGGSDVSPYCDTYGGYVLNATIDRYAYATIQSQAQGVHFEAQDIQKSCDYDVTLDFETQCPLVLHKAVYAHVMHTYNAGRALPVSISTYCDAPPGSGLGSSSTLVVAMLKAYVEWLNLTLDDYALAQAAYKIERIDCGFHGGRQDQYSASFGGVNFMEFHPQEKVIVNPLRIRPWIISELESSLILYFSGVSRESSNIIEAQRNSLKYGKHNELAAMHGIKGEAISMKEALLRGDFDAMSASLRTGWESKKKSAAQVSNPLIDEIFSAALKAGATAGKVSGAGGGGFLMFMTPLEKRLSVVRMLQKYSGQVTHCHFTKYGAQAWRVGNSIHQ